MKEFEFTDPTVFARRGAVDSFIASFGAYQTRGEKVVKRHLGLSEIPTDPDATFSLAAFMRAMRELQEQFGVSFMRKIGAFTFDRAVFPPGLDTPEKLFSSTHTAYYMNHTETAVGKIGSYVWHTKEGGGGGVMWCDNPFPCAFDLGMLEAGVTRFAPEGVGKVTHDPGPCRHKGGEYCSYTLEW